MYLVGESKDIHTLIKKRDKQMMSLGGLRLSTGYIVKAVSDGDVILHAISNAILGCIQAGDIGQYFDDRDPANIDLDSNKILQFCLKKLADYGYRLVNIDLTVVCQRIMLKPYREEIVQSLQRLTKIKLINMKATRYEKKSNQIECNVVLLVKRENNVKK